MADSSFVPDGGAWEPWRPEIIRAALASVGVRWAIAAGWAIDLYLQKETRPHDDIEIAISHDSFEGIAACLKEVEWFAVGNGRAWPFADAPEGLHQTWGRDRADRRWRLDVFREPWNHDEWVFRRDPRIRRPLADAIEYSADAIPFLAPEIVLLFKARSRQRKDEADFEATLPTLSLDRIEWLRGALETVHPSHPWATRLGTAF